MPRQRIDMTLDEVAAFLARKRIAIVGTLGRDGAPDGEPAAFSWADGEARVTVERDGATHRNIAHDPRVVCSVEEFPSYAGIKGVALHGRAVLAGDAAGRATFRIVAARVESFDFMKMRR
jgi:nitroimidazol reductase NimA-like FMN-containing flavoprotein (pyridoxamine 5'-phosphate oxidase superfamily)